MKGKLTGADKAIEIIFNVLRGLFLIYLGISLVKVVQAGRQDQDWQDLARTPLIIVIAVVLGDILATFIVGTAYRIRRTVMDDSSSEFRRVNPILDARPRFGPIPADLILPWGAIAIVFYLIF